MSKHQSGGFVTIDINDDPAFMFWADRIADHSWNGFAIPAFTREVADAIAADCATLAEQFGAGSVECPVWDDARGGYVMQNAYYPAEEWEFIGPDSDGLYGIGAMSWTWTLAPEDDDS